QAVFWVARQIQLMQPLPGSYPDGGAVKRRGLFVQFPLPLLSLLASESIHTVAIIIITLAGNGDHAKQPLVRHLTLGSNNGHGANAQVGAAVECEVAQMSTAFVDLSTAQRLPPGSLNDQCLTISCRYENTTRRWPRVTGENLLVGIVEFLCSDYDVSRGSLL